MRTFNELLDYTETLLRHLPLKAEPGDLYSPIEYALSMGGKRLRPVMCLMACEMMGGNIEKAVPAATALEIFHNFTLVHDDIMDKAPIRRGQPTVYHKWNTDIAVLSGDTMFAIAYRELSKTDPVYLPEILKIFTQTAIEVCEGQQYDMNFEQISVISMAEYLEMIRLKTAVLLSCCLKTGAYIGGADTKTANLMYSLGLNLGMAFQLKDDLLDVFGNEKKFGKVNGGDIVSNKKTYLFIKALEVADENQKSEILRFYRSTDFDPSEKVDAVRHIFNELKIQEITTAEMDKYHQTSTEIIDSIPLPEEAKKEIRALSVQLSTRDI